MNNDTIILDPGYSRGLLKQALNEGFASPKFDSSHDDLDGSILKEYRKSKLAQKALIYLLIYPEIKLYHCHDSIDTSKLGSYVPITSILPKSFSTPFSYLSTNEGYRSALELKPIILPVLRHLNRQEGTEFLRINRETYDLYLKSFRDTGDGAFLKKLIEAVYAPQVMEFLAKGLAVNLADLPEFLFTPVEGGGNMGTSIAFRFWAALHQINNTLLDTIGLLESSQDLQVAATASWPLPKGFTSKSQVSSHPNDLFRCYYIFLEEVDAFPIVTSIEDVLRLREDKRIKIWRESLYAWAAELEAGKTESEKRMRKEIRLAMRDLKRVGKVRNISGLVTVVSLPIGIAETMTGYLGPGMAMTAISFMSEVWSRTIGWKHKWLLFGKPG